MAENIDHEWSPTYAAERLLPGADMKPQAELAKKIREAILSGNLEAERREPTGVYRNNEVYRLVRGPEYYLKPKGVIEWALKYGLDVPDEYRQWYQSVTKPKSKARAGGPREKTLYAVIAAMAKDIGYTPGDSSKSGQGKLKGIKRHTDLDEKTIREVITQALHHADNE